MASNTKITKKRRTIRRSKAGRRRKTKESRQSTAGHDELFAGLGEPGKPVESA